MTNTESTCQHCDREVRFGMTEQGFRGFVHIDTGLASCEERTAFSPDELYKDLYK